MLTTAEPPHCGKQCFLSTCALHTYWLPARGRREGWETAQSWPKELWTFITLSSIHGDELQDNRNLAFSLATWIRCTMCCWSLFGNKVSIRVWSVDKSSEKVTKLASLTISSHSKWLFVAVLMLWMLQSSFKFHLSLTPLSPYLTSPPLSFWKSQKSGPWMHHPQHAEFRVLEAVVPWCTSPYWFGIWIPSYLTMICFIMCTLREWQFIFYKILINTDLKEGMMQGSASEGKKKASEILFVRLSSAFNVGEGFVLKSNTASSWH